MEQKYKYMVATRCFTYNQSSYIQETLDGFVSQDTTFPVVFIIVDDASNDGEQDLLLHWAKKNLLLDEYGIASHLNLSYGEQFCARHKEKNNAFFVLLFLFENHYGKSSKMPYISEWLNNAKYHAYCEGDDFWIDSRKLQKQVNYLEVHTDYGLCHTDFEKYIQETGKRVYLQRVCTDGDVTRQLIAGNFFIAAPTALYRSSDYNAIDKEYRERGFLMGDLPLWIELSRLSKVKYLPDKTTVYRELQNSSAHSSSRLKKAKFQLNLYEVRKYFIDKYGYDELRKKNEQDLYYHKAIVFALQRNANKAIPAFLRGHHYSLKEIKYFITRFIVKP